LLYLYIGSGNHDKKILDISKQHGIMELITFNMEGKNMNNNREIDLKHWMITELTGKRKSVHCYIPSFCYRGQRLGGQTLCGLSFQSSISGLVNPDYQINCPECLKILTAKGSIVRPYIDVADITNVLS
jgi:hypothetical protein